MSSLRLQRHSKFPVLITTMENPKEEVERMKFEEYAQAEADLAPSGSEGATDGDTNSKVSALMQEVDASSKARQESDWMKRIANEVRALEKGIQESQETLAQLKAEQDLLRYQTEEARRKNDLYQEDIDQAR